MTEKKIRLYELLCLFIVVTSIAGIASISFDKFNPAYAVLSSITVLLFALAAFKIKPDLSKDGRFSVAFFAIFFLALFLRWGPYPHHVGGQDQGLYVNMAKVYERCGSLLYTDSFRKGMTAGQKELYDGNGGALVPGAVVADPAKSTIRLSFYPLHPIWMAIFSRLFGGEDNGVYALLFFSLLSIVAIYLLTLEISDQNKSAANLAALFACLNPGLVFMSKFPVTEISSLAYTASGFYFLARAYRALKQRHNSAILFLISAGFFNCFFYTRMSFFLILPFFLLLYICSIIDLTNREDRVTITIYFLSVVVLFVVSNVFYLRQFPELFFGTFEILSAPLGGKRIFILSSGLILLLAGIFCVFFVLGSPHRQDKARQYLSKYGLHASYLMIFGLLLALIVFFKYVGSGIEVPKWNLVIAPGLAAVRTSALYHFVLLLSPIGVLLIAGSPFLKQSRYNAFTIFLSVFLAYMISVVLSSPFSVIPYSYYFDRYLLSEIIPYSLIFLALLIALPEHKAAGLKTVYIAGAALISFYFAFFSFAQLGKTEGSYPEFFHEINDVVGNNDVLLFDMDSVPRPDHVRTPLTYYFDKKVFPIRAERDIDKAAVLQLANRFDRVFLLSGKKISGEGNFELFRTFQYREGFFISSSHAWNRGMDMTKQSLFTRSLLPYKHYEFGNKLFLYLKKQNSSVRKLDIGESITFEEGGNADVYKLSGWSTAEPEATWTAAPAAEISFTMTPSPVQVRMKARVVPLIWKDIKRQRANVYINDKLLCKWDVSGPGVYSCDMPVAITRSGGPVRVRFELPDAVRPVGLDSRLLGLRFYNIAIVKRSGE